MARALTTNERRELLRHDPERCEIHAAVTAVCDACGSTFAICDCHGDDGDLDTLLDVIGCECPHRPGGVSFGRARTAVAR